MKIGKRKFTHIIFIYLFKKIICRVHVEGGTQAQKI